MDGSAWFVLNLIAPDQTMKADPYLQSQSACGVYCMSKFAVRGVSETFMHELKPFGIKVLHVEPVRRSSLKVLL